MYKVKDVKVRVGYGEADLRKAVAKKLNTYVENIVAYKILKRSIDARNKNDVLFVLTLAVELKNDKKVYAEKYVPSPRSIAELGLGRKETSESVVVVGSGPAGLFCALTLATCGVKVTLLERGGSVDERVKKIENLKENGILDTETNVQFGEGGAGTFSDGKLNSGISNEYFGVLFGEFIASGAPEDIETDSNPHIGTDVLRDVIKNIHSRLVALGVTFRTHAKVTDVCVSDGRVSEVVVNGSERIKADRLVLAIGHSAEDTFRMLNANGVAMSPKPFSIGVRIEHAQDTINEARHGKFKDMLPPADYKLSAQLPSGRCVYSFCMCPGGEVTCSSDFDGAIVTNGMSNRARDGKYANSALLVSVTPADYPSGVFGGFDFRRKYELSAYRAGGGCFYAPAQRSADFLAGKISDGVIECSYRPGVKSADLSLCLPDYVVDGLKEGLVIFGRKIKGFDTDGVMIGVETRSSCPVRIERDANFESSIKGIYPCGEGAGYAGGITSSAIDGIKTAINLLKDL